jgi:6,7-dimethyl-8-ribityllumazine synthase
VGEVHAGFTAQLADKDFAADVESFDVPGAFERPLLAQKLTATGRYDGIVAAALVVDGGIHSAQAKAA